ncbi:MULTISPECIES: hypothetical protein [Butyricimonas]|uniref:hypothetical protein n=1 Tax=Butyricimonas TaxID=574697 RepID=UPI0007FB5ABD|nr:MULTISPECIES: hypothetical protein [Butyricimonas]
MIDPLLTGGINYDQRLPELEKEQQAYLQRIQELQKRGVVNESATPVWDEIDGLLSGLSDREFEFINNNQEFQESSSVITAILNREYLKIMRPRVENTKDGKDALEKHLTLVKRLKKSAADEVNKKYSMLDEYMEKYSDMSFKDYMAMKKGGKKK